MDGSDTGKEPLKPHLSGEKEDGGVNGGVNGEVNGGVNGGVTTLTGSIKSVYDVILLNPGFNTNQIAEHLHRSISTIEKQIAALKNLDAIEFRGAPKTGGYYAK